MDVDDDPLSSRGTVGERVALKRRAADASHASTSGAGVDDVPHVRQMHNWDCGLACVLASLRSMRCDPALNLPHLKALCPTTSIWTVDLAHLLRRFGVDVRFFTITLGANPEYAAESFYRDPLADDGARVDALFRGAERAGVQLARAEASTCVRYAAGLPTDDGSSSSSWISAPLGPNGFRKTSRTTRSSRRRDDAARLRVDESPKARALRLGVRTGDARHRDRAAAGPLKNRHTNPRRVRTRVRTRGTRDTTSSLQKTRRRSRACAVEDPAGAATRTRVGESAMESARKSFGTDEDLFVVRRAGLDPARVREAMEAANGGEKA